MRPRRSERGAVLVEIILIVPMLLVISLGVFDIGLGWKTSLTVTSATRSGARVVSNLGVDAASDRSALASMAASFSSIPSTEIERVVIFRSSSPNGTVPAGCLTATALSTGGSAASLCNVYSAADLAAAQTATTYTGNCASSRDRFWCPSTRENSQGAAAGPDYAGVYVRINHGTKTKIFGSTMVIEETAVMRIEPNAGEP